VHLDREVWLGLSRTNLMEKLPSVPFGATNCEFFYSVRPTSEPGLEFVNSFTVGFRDEKISLLSVHQNTQ